MNIYIYIYIYIWVCQLIIGIVKGKYNYVNAETLAPIPMMLYNHFSIFSKLDVVRIGIVKNLKIIV